MKITILILFIMISGCSRKSSERSLKVTRASLATSDLVGGVIVKVTNTVTLTSQIYELKTAPFDLLLTDGKWTFELVGFRGPDLWKGDYHCGSSSLDLLPTTTEIVITATSDCAVEPFKSLIGAKKSTWDEGKWDEAKWAP